MDRDKLIEAMARAACRANGEDPDADTWLMGTPNWIIKSGAMELALDALLSPEVMEGMCVRMALEMYGLSEDTQTLRQMEDGIRAALCATSSPPSENGTPIDAPRQNGVWSDDGYAPKTRAIPFVGRGQSLPPRLPDATDTEGEAGEP